MHAMLSASRSLFFMIFPRWLIQTNFLLPALDLERTAIRKVKSTCASAHCVFRHQQARHSLGQTFDAAREIDRVADRGVLALVLGADDAHHCGTRMDADAHIEARTQLPQLAFEF